MPAPETFATKTDAEVWLTLKTEADILNDDWINPEDGKVLFGDYAARPGSTNGRTCGPRQSSYTATCCAAHLDPDLRDQCH